MRLVSVAVPVPFLDALTYAVPDTYPRLPAVGARVRVPVGARTVIGCVVGHDGALEPDTAPRDITSVLDDTPYLSPAVVELCGWVADYYMAGYGDAIAAAMPPGSRREDVYIANVIKCRPPHNRNPEPDEVEQCEPFLFRQIDVIKPKVIVALGTFAAQSLLRTTEPITRLRGREYKYRDAILMPTYHPAYLLRTPSAKRDVWEDMKRVRVLLSEK